MSVNILKNIMSETIIFKATRELKEWQFINLSLQESDFKSEGIECSKNIVENLIVIQKSASLFDDPEFSLVQYVPYIEKLNTEIHDNYNRLMSMELESGEKEVLEENAPSDYSSLAVKVKGDYIETRDVLREGQHISDFNKIEGFDPDITPYLARIAKRGTKSEEEFLRNCTIRVWEQNDEVFGNIEPNHHKLYPDLKNRVCEAVYTRFKDNPELIRTGE